MTTFTDVKFMTAQEKARTLKQWDRFLAGNMAESLFTKALYNHLHLHCNHIAHYDRGGFFHEQCSTEERRADFLLQFANDHESGRLYWGAGEDYRDLGTAMYECLVKHFDTIMESSVSRAS